ncbi:hypothetical protein NST04_23950 [Paenibacillus sp. FSL H7-0756]|uniref:hypothetical protein n=1 Tax=unclassified Paenibacillus TaxID=185978 RepID=UPI0030F5A805
MIQMRFAKSAIEHEEGMNHLWIQLALPCPVQNARLQFILPAGLHRSPDLSGTVEDGSGRLRINEMLAVTDLYFEIFTLEPIPCGEYTINVELSYTGGDGTLTNVKQEIPLMVVSEEESAAIRTDEEVVRRIKELRGICGSNELRQYNEYTPAKLIRLDSSAMSEWEKKYRVEGVIR